MTKIKKKQKRARTRAVQQFPQRRSRGAPARWLAAAAAVGITVLATIGALWLRDGDRGSSTSEAEPGPVHVHGLGINPSDGALYIATHTGLWRLRPGARTSERVGESRQDTMGFTVVGPDHFLGSGHPDSVRLPPLLGLIQSRDRGEEWVPISLVGEADFHVLRAAGSRVYGYDVTNERLMVSTDGGRTWTEHRSPAVIDLAPDPVNPTRVIAATERGLLVSRNAGASWRPLGNGVGLLAWPEPAALYLVTGSGDVMRSNDRGRRWTRAGTIGGQPAAFVATTKRELYAALHEGAIVRSRDGGRTWEEITS